MQLYELLNELLELIELLPPEAPIKSQYFFCPHIEGFKFIVQDNNVEQFQKQLKTVVTYLNKETSPNFTQYTIERFIKESMLISKVENINYTNKNIKNFFQPLTACKPITLQAITPIVGIYFDESLKPIPLGCFEIGHSNYLPETKEIFIYLKANITPLYDPSMIHKKAPLYFNDFVRILLFIAGDFHRNYLITAQNIAYQPHGNDQIETDGGYIYDYYDLDMKLQGRSYHKNLNKILDINNFFSNINSNKLNKLWEIYQQRNELLEQTDFQQRILSAGLAVGESIRSEEDKNSIIYTCIALESLFTKNREEGIRSIISKSLSVLVSTDQKQYDNYYKLTTEIYDARSTIVHGRQLSKLPDFKFINKLIRDAIIELLNNSKYKDVQTIGDLRQIIIDANFSD